MGLRVFISCSLAVYGFFGMAQNSQPVLDYINTYKKLAMEEMQRTGVPASVKLAQGIHETEAGNSMLVKKSNNHFGIKCKSNWTGKKVYHDDDARGECFRSYPSAEESYRDHSDFLRGNERYAFLFKLEPEDYKGWVYGLKEAGYATNTKYSQLLIKLIEEYNLQEYTLVALGKSPSLNNDVIPMEVKMQEITDNAPVAATTSPYPAGEFEINKSKVILVKAGTSLLSIANQYELPLSRLLNFNDLLNDAAPEKDQLIFLQRKRRKGANIYHVMRSGESLYDVCQLEGIRMENLLQFNQLPAGVVVAEGEKVYLQSIAPVRPLLEEEKNKLIQPDKEEGEYPLHIVQPKESLYSIAKKYKVTVGQLQEWNKLNNLVVKTGQQLIVKVKP
jgi:LysM repeat protein